jgi:hypothetical protein
VLVVKLGIRMRFTPIKKLQAARATAIHGRTRDGLNPCQRIVRESVHLIAFFKAVHGVRAAAYAARVPGKKEAAMRVKKRMIGAGPAVAFRTLIHVRPQQFFKSRPVDTNQALPPRVTRQGDGRTLSKGASDLTPSRHRLPDIIHRIIKMSELSFDAREILREKIYK